MKLLWKTVLIVHLFAIFVVSCVSAAPAEDNRVNEVNELSKEELETITIEGVPTVYGNEPRSYVAIVTTMQGNELTYYVHPDHQNELRKMTGNRYVFTGHLYTGTDRFFDARLHDGVFVPKRWERTNAE